MRCRTWSRHDRTIRGVRCRTLGALAHGERAIVWSLRGSTRFNDGVSIDGPMHRPDVFKMQSVRHTPCRIGRSSVGGRFVQGVEIAWPSVSGAFVPRGHLLIVSVQACILHGRKQWERNKTRYGHFWGRCRGCAMSHWPDFVCAQNLGWTSHTYGPIRLARLRL